MVGQQVLSDAGIRAQAVSRGLYIKRMNALAAVASGTIPAAIMGSLFPASPSRWLIGFLIGTVWANGFEYGYHRFLLHTPGTLLAQKHLAHHASVGSLTEAEDLNLGGSPLWIAFLFLANGLPIVTVDLLFRLRLAPGVLLGFVVYVLVVEEMHWRIHLGKRLPAGLHFARRHHFLHHDRPDRRYNIFLPVFDFVFGSLCPVTPPTRAVSSPAAIAPVLPSAEHSRD